jgi:outer membrane protein assembly factor BamA
MRKRTAIPIVIAALLTAGVIVWSTPTAAGLVTIEDIPQGIPADLAFGEILREIRIEGNDYTREDVIRMALKSRIGHPLTQENTRLDLLWVTRLGAFTAVTLATEPVAEGVVLIVTVTEATPYIPSLSFALTQENGMEIGPAFSSSNILGTTARASAYARFGGATNLGVKYAQPQLAEFSWLSGWRAEYFHRDRINKLLDFDETTDEITFEYMRSTSDDMRTGLRFRYIALKSDRDGVTLGADNFDQVPSLGLFLQNDSRNAVYPTGGWFIDLEGARYGLFGGDGDYWRVDLDVRCYVGLGFIGDRHSLAVSTLASLVNGEIGSSVPPWQEFYIGGTNSMRGWSLGSRQGKNQWLNTVEYWYRLMDQKSWRFWFIDWRMGLQVGVFGDFGTAWSDDREMDRNWIGGGGAGLRLTLPVVTVVRFDLAYGEDDLGVRVFIGGSEKATAQKTRVR